MMNEQIKNILEKCNEAYSKGEVYFLKDDEYPIIEQEFNIVVPHLDVDDHLYDIIYFCAKEKWPDDEFFNELTSENTGYGIDITHEIPMGSMEELKEGDLEKWIGNHKDFVISDKLDGCSIILTYINGQLIKAATRGHGITGKDVMRHIKQVPSIPKYIDYKDKLIVRGELLFKKNMIQSILDDIELKTGKKQKNGRNTIAGALNRKDTDINIFNNCKFVSYWTSDNQGTLGAFKQLEYLGFLVPYYQECSNEVLTDENCLEIVKTRLKFSNYELDGIIITQNDYTDNGYVGNTINPKCSRKFKMGIYDNIAESKVVNIDWKISRWNVFTPVLEIEPTEICGCTVTNITAHNYENVLNVKCGIGSKIKFSRAGLVIPKLEEVLEPSEEYNLPNCKTKKVGVDLVFDEEDPYSDENLFEYARERDIQALDNFGKKLKIDQWGYGNCAKLYDHFFFTDSIILTPVDVFNIPDSLFTYLIGKNGEKIVNSLNTIKQNISEVLFASACGLFGQGIGESILKLVYDKYNTLEVSKEQLEALEGFGDTRVEQYLECLSEYIRAKEYVNGLGITFGNNIVQKTSNNLEGIVVCFTGIRDKDFSKFINDNGGIASDNWKSSTTHLIVKDKNTTTSKMQKAIDKGCEILTLEEAYKEFNYER